MLCFITIFNVKIPWVQLVPWVLCNTTPITCKYGTHATMGTVYVGMGMVCEILTCGIPVTNPICRVLFIIQCAYDQGRVISLLHILFANTCTNSSNDTGVTHPHGLSL